MRRANRADIGRIISIERLPGYDRFLTTSTRAEHVSRMAQSDNAYWLACHPKTKAIIGFAIVTGLKNPHAGPRLFRIAMVRPHEGHGRQFIKSLLAWAFVELKTHRFWLQTFAHDKRAKKVFKQCGFVPEGVLRKSYRFSDGTHVDRALLSMLASEFGEEAT